MNQEVTPNSSIPALFEKLGVKEITPSDNFSIEYAEGFLTATINRDGGSVEVIRKHVEGGFTEITAYDPNIMDKELRDNVIFKLQKDGFSQSEIARRIGFTQATVSNVLRRLKAEQKESRSSGTG
jgi:DNA-binding NarL/FixJ family response regulator